MMAHSFPTIIIQNHRKTRAIRWDHHPLSSFSSPLSNTPKPKISLNRNNEDAEAQRRRQRARRRNEHNPNHPSYKRERHRKKSNSMKNNNKHSDTRRRRLTPAEIRERLQRAMDVERRLTVALDRMRRLVDFDADTYKRLRNVEERNDDECSLEIEIPSFPSVRECNAALASIGDTGDFKRAIQMFGAMRKTTLLVSKYQILANNADGDDDVRSKMMNSYFSIYPPSPTLVTYSTLMSRAVALGEESVALRLWRLMTLEKNFYTNLPPSSLPLNDDNDGGDSFGAPIVPDIKAVNILMNAFAKLADTRSAGLLMKQLRLGGGEGEFEPLIFVEEDERQDDNGDFQMKSRNAGVSGGGLDIEGLIRVVPKMEANIVTFNTYIDACHRAGDLDAALEALHFIKANPPIKPNGKAKYLTPPLQPDLRTYTSLISTVARRTTRSSGARDPDLAFSLLDEMINTMKITPNGMTYCALIDVCGRCHRVDLALKGLRMMLRQKASTEKWGDDYNANISSIDGTTVGRSRRRQNLYNEVGAWTSAIKACGRAGRLDTAITLFHTMQKFGAKPNTVTCGCLTDCMLKSNDYEEYVGETVRVMRYMKEEGLEPSEVMYTSLMSAATRLAKVENERRGKLVLLDFGDGGGVDLDGDGNGNSNGVVDGVVDGDGGACGAGGADGGVDGDCNGGGVTGEDGLEYRSSKISEGGITDKDAFVGVSDKVERTKALEIYTELILSLVSPAAVTSPTTTAFDCFGSSTSNCTSNNGVVNALNTSTQQRSPDTNTESNRARTKEANDLLLKVFLVFQEMKASGSDPDLACYNAILKACARAGDTARLMEVMQRIQGDGFRPNNTSWREMLRGAANARQSDVAENIWEMALRYDDAKSPEGGSNRRNRYAQHGEGCWIPNADAFEVLISAYIRHASVVKSRDAKTALFVKVIQAYMEVVEGNDTRGLQHVKIDLLKKNVRLMSMVLKAAISVEKRMGLLHNDERGSSQSNYCTFSQEELNVVVAEILADNRSLTR